MTITRTRKLSREPPTHTVPYASQERRVYEARQIRARSQARSAHIDTLFSSGFLATFCSQLADHPPLPQRNSERALTIAEEPFFSDSMSSPNISFGNISPFDVCETPTAPQPWSRPHLTGERLYEYNEPIGYNLVNDVPHVEVIGRQTSRFGRGVKGETRMER
jgi:hypothetical protein